VLDSLRIQAATLIVHPHKILTPGQVVCRLGQIVEVTERCDSTPDIDLGDAILLPGLVNAHTHLEFSDLQQPLPAGRNFPEWIGAVVAHRRAALAATDARQQGPQAIAAGLQELRAASTALVADIVTPPWHPTWLHAEPAPTPRISPSGHLARACSHHHPAAVWQPAARAHLHPVAAAPAVIACLEQLGLDPSREQAARAWRDAVLADAAQPRPPRLLELGLSPHAPYSMRTSLLDATFTAARNGGGLVAMHLAESEAEREWLDHGTGPFVAMFARMAVADPTPTRPGTAELIRQLAAAPRALLIHGNYLRAAEIDLLASAGGQVSVVYCPRTHRHFGHAAHPWQALQAAGVPVVLGTDSRSTNPDLHIWSEMQTALQEQTWLDPHTALSAITDRAAAALGQRARFGSLEPGQVAAMTVAFPTAALPRDATGILEACIETPPENIFPLDTILNG
jgi:aminodeoxyfutalosine deaminase